MNKNGARLPTSLTAMNPNDPIGYLSAEDIMVLFSCSENYFYSVLTKDPDFPKPIQLSPRMTRWLAPEIRAYQNKQIRKARAASDHDQQDGVSR